MSAPPQGPQRPMDPMDPPPGLLVRLMARLAGWLWRPRALAPPTPAELRRVLVVRPDDRVGNALLTVPLVRALQRALPQAQVDLLLAQKRSAIADGLPGLRVVGYDKREPLSHPLRFWRWLRALRSYDAAVDASHWHSFSLTAALLARIASRRWLVGVDRGPMRALASAALPLPPPLQPDVRSKLELLAGLGLPLPADAPPLETALGAVQGSLQARDEQLRSLQLEPGRHAALNPGARKADHRWPPERFGALARALWERLGLRSLVLWGPGEEALAQRVCEVAGPAAVLAPPTDLELLAAHFRGAALVVTNDTGPMHLAVACGAPVVALQLSADAARWSHPSARFAGVPAAPDARDADGAAAIRAALDAAARLFALTAEPAAAEVAAPPALAGAQEAK